MAGRTIWVARLVPTVGPDETDESGKPAWRLASLDSLERLCGTAERAPALAHLVDLIAASDSALWALDFPFGMPVEVIDDGLRWADQFDVIAPWGDDAYGFGLECLRRAKLLGGPNHIRRQTDSEAKAPFDCYHYRIIYQSFFGMRDVLGPLRNLRATAVLPFHYRRLARARRVLVEACPASTLKRLGLPHQNYKQPKGGPLEPHRRRNRRVLLDGLARRVSFDATQRHRMMRNPGGDAIDAVIAAVGALDHWGSCDHSFVARHPRYPREGRLYF